MPLQPRANGCAVIERAEGGQWGPTCNRSAPVRAVWQFESERRRILLCEQHAAELIRHQRLTLEARF